MSAVSSLTKDAEVSLFCPKQYVELLRLFDWLNSSHHIVIYYKEKKAWWIAIFDCYQTTFCTWILWNWSIWGEHLKFSTTACGRDDLSEPFQSKKKETSFFRWFPFSQLLSSCFIGINRFYFSIRSICFYTFDKTLRVEYNEQTN